MTIGDPRLFRLALGLAAAVVVLDQITKWLILDLFETPPYRIEVMGFFNLVLVFNTGISFGLFSGDSAAKAWILSGLALAVVGALAVWLRQQIRAFPSVAIGLVIGGAIGNVIDRVMPSRPGVVDFLDFHVAGWHWPAFNVADSAITIGVIFLIYDGLFLGDRDAKTYDE